MIRLACVALFVAGCGHGGGNADQPAADAATEPPADGAAPDALIAPDVAPAIDAPKDAAAPVEVTVDAVDTNTPERADAGAPDDALVPAVPLETRTIPPDATDPAIGESRPVHIVVVGAASTGRLVVFFPGTGGVPANQRRFLETAAGLGHHAIGLAYDNDVAVNDLCADRRGGTCEGDVRVEVIQGRDTSPLVDVPRARSIENRLAKLLAHLARRFPDEKWAQYLDGETPVWGRITFGGHSQGGGHAAMLGKLYNVGRVLLVSATEAAAWTREPHATPADRYYGFVHRDEESRPTFVASWQNLGIPGTAVDVDRTPAPWPGAHRFITAAPPRDAGPDKLHGSTVVDAWTPLASDGSPLFAPVWAAMMGR